MIKAGKSYAYREIGILDQEFDHIYLRNPQWKTSFFDFLCNVNYQINSLIFLPETGPCPIIKTAMC